MDAIRRPPSQTAAATPAQSPGAPPATAARHGIAWRTLRHCVAACCLIPAGWTLACYPLGPLPLLFSLLLYAMILVRWPGLFPLLLAVIIPAVDLGLWTGWMMVSEADLFIVTTIAVLLVRDPPAWNDLRLPRTPALVLLILIACWLLAASIGLNSTLGASRSDNVFLRPDNAVRLAKSLFQAAALLPFLQHRQRCHGDAMRMLASGFAAGLAVVAVIVLAERLLFAGVFDMSAGYRVAGPFSSMRVGGGHIGAYAALAIPFCLSLAWTRPRWLAAALALGSCLLGGYAIIVTFARTAYASGLVAMLVTAAAWRLASIRLEQRHPDWDSRANKVARENNELDRADYSSQPESGLASPLQAGSSQPPGDLPPRRRSLARVATAVLAMLLLAAFAATALFSGMQGRFAASLNDLATRQDNWRAGLAVRDTTLSANVFGMGLGTYQRAMFTRSPANRPTDLVIRQDAAGSYASMDVQTPFFLGQKITLPVVGSLHLIMQARSLEQRQPDWDSRADKVARENNELDRADHSSQPESGLDGSATGTASAAAIAICDKLLLYSDNCRGSEHPLPEGTGWTTVRASFATGGLGRGTLAGWLHRPVEFSLYGPPGRTLQLRDIRLTDDAGQSRLQNGAFTDGLDHWIFTDDSHIAWRMLNQYLMLFFETGALGLAAFCALACVALAGGLRACRRGDRLGAPVAGAIASFMVSCLFDNLLEAPRLALLFFLLCGCGLMQWQAASTRPSPGSTKPGEA